MTHVEHDTLWSFARGELSSGADQVLAHLATCADCQAQLDDVRAAQAVLFSLPEPTPMPEPVARRVGAALAEEVDRRAARNLRAWWARLFEPRFALAFAVTAALLLVVLQLVRSPAPVAPVAKQDVPVVAPTVKAPVAPSPVPAPVEVKKLTASVASARKAKVSKSQVSKSQVLAEGSTIATETGGSAWLRLPDGSRAGLTGNSTVTLAKLEARALTLEVSQGNLALVVPHREDRVLTVSAGEVQVRDLGTSFLVSKTPGRVLVAVEEGSVEVTTPGATRTVSAGHAVTWEGGALKEMKWDKSPPPERPVTAPAQPSASREDEVSSAARLREEDDEDLTPEPEPVVAQAPDWSIPAEQWDQLPQGPDASALPPEQVAAVEPPPAPAAPAKKQREGFSLRMLERRIKELQRTIEGPFVPPETMRASRARDVNRLADANDCVGAVAIADRWLAEPKSASPLEPKWRRGVLVQKLRCLSKMGRADEANAVRVELER